MLPQATDTAEDTLASIAAAIRGCRRCPLHETRANAVPGAGPDDAGLMLIGEGPGEQEDQSGLPFVGVSGKTLTDKLQQAGMPRERVFLTNMVKCRTPNNRDPEPHEIEACLPYLKRQISVLDPDLIVTVGAVSTRHFIPDVKITQDRGVVRKVGERLVYPILHPAYLLRNRSQAPQFEKDLKALPELAEICRLPPHAD